MATLLAKGGREGEAAAVYRKVLEADSNNVAALNDLGLLLAPGDPQKAFPYAEAASQLAPEDPDVLATLGWEEYKLQRYPEALKHLEKRHTGKRALIRASPIIWPWRSTKPGPSARQTKLYNSHKNKTLRGHLLWSIRFPHQLLRRVGSQTEA